MTFHCIRGFTPRGNENIKQYYLHKFIMNYYRKYLKYKTKNEKLKKQLGGGGADDQFEIDLFEKYGIQTMDKMEEDEIEEDVEIQNKFFISCHGMRLVNSSIAKIKVPENFFIYFQAENGQTCALDDYIDKMSRICYNDNELLSWFKNVNYDNYREGEPKPEFWNRRWCNKYVPNSVIYDCVLSGADEEAISSMVVFCGSIIGGQIMLKIMPTEEYLLSQIITMIIKYITRESILPPYNVFCSFCLVNNNDVNNDIRSEQQHISLTYPSLYTFENVTPPVDY